MTIYRVPARDEPREDVLRADAPQGQAVFGLANLRPQRTGLPFVVFISQRDAARHDVRVKVSTDAKVRVDEMGSYALRPFRHVAGPRLAGDQERALETWAEKNLDTLVRYWDGDIAFTEDAIDLIVAV